MARGALPIDEPEDTSLGSVPDPFYKPLDTETSVSDYFRALGSGVPGAIAGAAGFGQWLTGAGEDSTLAAVRDWGEREQKGILGKMTPGAQNLINSGVLPSEGVDFTDKEMGAGDIGASVVLKGLSSAPSLAASVLPGALVGRLALSVGAGVKGAATAGTVAGSATGGALAGGDVFNSILEGIMETTDDQLQAENPVYAGLREMGVDEATAKQRIVERAAGMKPLYMAALTTMMGKFSIEGVVAGRAAGEAGKGAMRAMGTGALGEALTEGVEEGAGSWMTQYGLTGNADESDPEIDWMKALEAAAQGAVVGGPMGGAVGAVTGRRPGEARPATEDIPADVGAALTGNPVTPQGTAPVAPTPEPVSNDAVAQALSQVPEVSPDKAVQPVAEPAVPGATAPVPGATAVQEALEAAPVSEAARVLDPAVNAALTPPTPAPGPAAPLVNYDPDVGEEIDVDDPTPPAPALPPVPVPAPQTPAQAMVSAPTPTPAPVDVAPAPMVAAASAPVVEAPPPVGSSRPAGDLPIMEEASPEPETAGLAPTLTRTEEGGRRILTDEVAQQQVNADLEAQAKGRGAKITADIKKMREGPRISAKESERIAAGEGVAVALSSDPEDFNTPAGRKRFYDFAERMAEASEKAGTPLDPILAEVRTLRGKTRGGGAVQKAARARLVELRAAYAEQTTKQADAKREAGAVVRETEEEAKTRKQAEKLTAAANAMRDIVQELPLSKAAAAGSLKALEQHADAVIERAKASGANVLDLQTGAKLDPFLTYLANVRDLKRLLRGGQSGTASAEVQAVIRERVADFVNDDFLLRQGAGDELQARRAAQATKQGASYDENAATPQDDAREGTDQVEAYDEAVGVGDTTREEEDGPDAFKEDDDAWASATQGGVVDQERIGKLEALAKSTTFAGERKAAETKAEALRNTVSRGRERATTEVSADAVTAGKDRAGTFTAAKKGERQKIASSTAPRAEAIKALIRTKMTSAAKPVEVNTPADLAAVRKDVDPAPTEAQKEAGNYAKAHVFYGGMKVAIETPKGGTRSGTDRNGTAWSVKLPADYGYIKQTTGADGAQLDVYLGPNPSSARVFVVDQKDVDTGKFDEHKALLGYDSQEDAVATYLAGFSDGRGAERMLGVTELTLGQFRLWSHGRYKLPVSSKGAELKAKLAAKTHAEMKATTDPVVAAENLKEMRAVENADVVDPPILPRKVWETIPYVEGEVHPFVLRKNKMREWANALTDEQYDALQRYYGQTSHGFNFPRYLGVGLEPERAIIEWQSFLDGKPGRGYSAEGEAAANRQIDAFERKMARVDDSATPASAALDGEDIVTNLNAMLRNADMSQFTGLHGAVVGRVQKRILALAGDVKVRIVSQARMMELYADEMERTGKPGIPSGFYDPARDEIVLREDKLDDDAEGTILALHEGVHAAFAAAMEKRPNLKRFVKGLLDTAQARFERENPGTKLPYGFTDEHEFLAEALSNREFVEFLANTPVGNVDRMRARTLAPGAESVWTKLLTKIKTVLGFHPGDTTLDFLLRAVHQLDNGATRDRIDGRKFGRFDRDALRDRAGSFDDAMRGVGLKLRTMHQIMQKYRGLFPTSKGDALEIIVEAVQRMSRTAKVYTQDGHEIAEKFMQLRRTNPKEADAAAKFMIDATQADFMPVDKANATQADLLKANHWLKPTHARHRQAVSQLVPMNNRFMALAPETRAYILQSAKYYADMQNMKAKEIVNVIIDNHNETAATAISDADRAMLIQHVVSGTLTEADKTLVGNDVTFNDLVTARGLRVRNGLYFPLMRHGNFVVRATAKLGNLYGGTLVPGIKGNNVIEWRAGDDKTARAMFEQFADDPESLDITSQGKVYYLKGTNTVVSAANAKGQDVDVAYRARVQRDATMMFDSSTQARKFIREAKARGEYEDDSIDDKPLPKADQGNPTDLGTQQFAGIISSIEKRTDISKETKAVMLATMQQAALRMMTGNRIQQRSLARRGVYGASEDMARNQIQYAQASGHYLAKIQHMGPIRDALKDMRAMVGRDKDSADRSAVLGEIEKRINDPRTMDPDGSAQWVQDIMLLSYLDKLASPAYSVFNGMQPWMTTLPVLSGQHNPLVVGYEINRAYNAIASITAVAQGVMNTGTAIRGVGKISIDTRDVAGSIRKNLAKQGDGEDLLRLINTMTDRNMLDDGAGMEIAGAVGNGRGAWGTGLAKLDRAARQLPLAMEQINRSVSAVAAYRLAKSKGMSHEQAVNYALDIVQNTQGDYSSQNAPRIFNVPALRPALQFKKYAQMMSALLVDLVQKSFGPNSPKAERVAAMRSLMAIVTVQVAMAGALSLPGFELVKIVAMVGAALGLTDGWEEWERRMQGWAEEAMGKTPAELVTKGVLTRGLGFIPGMPPGGIDASTRLSLADMWTFGEPKGNDRDSIYAYLAQFMLGAPGSLGVDMLQGAKAFVDGDTTKGFINIIPNKFVSDVIKATTGPSSSNLTSPQVTSEQVAQALGFRSGRMVDKGEEIGDSINKSKRQEQRKKDLSRAYTNATSKSELIKIKAQIVAHNKTADMRHKVFITGLDNRRAATEKEKRAIRQ